MAHEGDEVDEMMVLQKVSHLIEQIAQMGQDYAEGRGNSKEQMRSVAAQLRALKPEELKYASSYFVVCSVIFCQFMAILMTACFQGCYLYVFNPPLSFPNQLSSSVLFSVFI